MSNTVDEFANNLKNAERLTKSFGIQAIALSLSALQRVVEVYPPQPDRMRSGRFNTYVRGVGHYPITSFKQDIKSPGGYKVLPTKKSQIRMTSEQMNKRFRQVVTASGTNIHGRLSNEASYSGWVLGTEDQGETPHQVPWHTETGWVSEETGLESVLPVLNEQIGIMMNRLIESL